MIEYTVYVKKKQDLDDETCHAKDDFRSFYRLQIDATSVRLCPSLCSDPSKLCAVIMTRPSVTSGH